MTIAVRFNGWTERQAYRHAPAHLLAKRRRWTVRAQIWGIDQYGRLARFSSTFRTPNAMRWSDLAGSINALLTDVAQEMRDTEQAEGLRFEHASAGWLAVSESGV